MKALCWYGKNDIRCDTVEDPKIEGGHTLRSGQTHVKRYLDKLTKLIQERKVDMTSIISHRSAKLEDGPNLYKKFKSKEDNGAKVVFHTA